MGCVGMVAFLNTTTVTNLANDERLFDSFATAGGAGVAPADQQAIEDQLVPRLRFRQAGVQGRLPCCAGSLLVAGAVSSTPIRRSIAAPSRTVNPSILCYQRRLKSTRFGIAQHDSQDTRRHRCSIRVRARPPGSTDWKGDPLEAIVPTIVPVTRQNRVSRAYASQLARSRK